MCDIRDNCIVIGLCGKMGSGKDYIAGILCKDYLNDSKRIKMNVSFADQLKMCAMFLDSNRTVDCPPEDIATVYKEYFVTKPSDVRRHIQTYGEGLRSQNPNIWVYTLYVEMLKQWDVNGVNVFVISDVRYPKEVEFIKNIGGYVIRVDAPQRTRDLYLRYENESINTHISETFVDTLSTDYTISNDVNDSDELRGQLDVIMGVIDISTNE